MSTRQISDQGYLLCKVCDFEYMHLVGTIEAHDNDSYELTKLVINGKHTIDCQNKKKYSYRSQGNIHLLYRCEEGHFSIISFDGHKGVVLFDRNTLMNDLTMFLNEKTKDDRDKKQFDFVMSYAILGYIEDFLSIETT
ncbi:MAG TPA: hypothetical protein GXZ82_15885 [Firmicutes bacterium]|nr:hypothetical protein [Bacillota bacterium]